MTLFFPTYRRFPVLFVKGDGCWLYDAGGKKYLDMFSGIGVTSLGHSHHEVTKVIKEQAEKHLHLSNLLWCPAQLDFAQELLKTVSFDAKVFLTNSGAEAIETAIKLARLWGKRERWKILVFRGSFHGRTMGALSATSKFRDQFEPLVPGFEFVDIDIKAVKKILGKDFCAVLIEPIQGEAGIKLYPDGFLEELWELCRRRSVLLILDEIQTGVGKTGKFWAFENFGIEPDVFVSAKALGGGLPLGACIARKELAELMNPGTHASTFGGNPLACAAGKVTIKLVKKMLPDVKRKGKKLKDKLKKIVGNREVRGMGLMLGVEFKDMLKTPEDVLKATNFFFQQGILVNFAGTALRIMPPFTIKDYEIELFLEVLEKSVKCTL